MVGGEEAGREGEGAKEEGGRERGKRAPGWDGKGKCRHWSRSLVRFTAIKGDLLDWMIRAIDTAFPFPNEFGQGA